MTPPRPAGRAGAALLALALAACAHRGALPRDLADRDVASASPRDLAASALAALLANDAARAVRRADEALRRDPSEPWARWAAALLARRSLDDEAEIRHLVALVQRTPAHPLAPLAARRLGEAADRSAPAAEEVEAGLAAALASGRLAGLTAFRARSARIQAAEVLGEAERAARLRSENGAVTAWTLLGPASPYRVLDLERAFPPEAGLLPARLAALPGLPPAEARVLPVPEGIASLEGEPAAGDVFYLAADLQVARGGDYLVAVGCTASAFAWIDGAEVAERRAAAGYPPTAQIAPIRLGAGRHRLLLKIGRSAGGARAAVSVARTDGTASDVEPAPAAPGAPAPAVRPGRPPAPLNLAPALAAPLEGEMGPVVARLAAARDAMDSDREAAVALLEEALALAPGSAQLLTARAEAAHDDPSADGRTGRSQAEALLEKALAADPGLSAARMARLDLMRGSDRQDDAEALLAALPPADAGRPRALLARARQALQRGFAEGAEALAARAVREAGLCAAAEILYGEADRRDAVAAADEMAKVLSRCGGGRERLADHLRRRGDAAGAVAILARLARAAPAAIDRRLDLARALAAAGDPAAAARELEDLSRLWPRDARLWKRRAELLDVAGDDAGARAARDRALALDPADLALLRGRAREDGAEPLQDLGEDGSAALAAYRAAAPREDSSGVYVLDHAAVEAWRDGAYAERTHQVVQLLDQRAVERFGEVQVPPGADLLVARTHKKDGRVLEAEERGEKGTVSLPGLEPGDAAEWIWLRTVPARGPALPGFTADTFLFRGDLPMWRTAYAVAAPRGAGLTADARRIEPPLPVAEGAREVLRYSRERVPAQHPEPGAPAEAEYLPAMQVGAGAGPDALPLALADAFAECCRPNLAIRRLAAEIEASVPAGGRGGEPLLRAAHARVAALVQGQGGGLADQAGQVLSRGRGSRLVLLKAVLDALGVKARLAVGRDFGRDPAPSPFPRPELYPVALLHVERGGRSWWIDAGARQVPFGTLPPGVAGQEAWVLPAPGESPRLLRISEGAGAAREIALRIQLDPDGNAEVEGSERYAGWDAVSYKVSLERLDSRQRRQGMEGILSRTFRGARIESLEFTGEERAEAPLVVKWRLTVPAWARAEEGRLVAEAPLFAARLSARTAQRAERETPLLLPQPERLLLRVEVVPPPGWRAAPRPPPEVRGRFGGYRRSERAEGAALRREDAYVLERGRVPPGDWPAFAVFAAAIDEAQAWPMVFVGAPPGVAATRPDGAAKAAGSLAASRDGDGHAP